MKSESLVDQDWLATLERLGGAALLEDEAREAGAFARKREIKCAVDLLRLTLAYCLGTMGLRLTAGWAAALGFASLSNVAVLKRVRKASPWLEIIVARLIAGQAAARACKHAKNRRFRLVDATVVAKASRLDRTKGGVWRVHAVFDLDGGTERFSAFELTDELQGERLDRAAVVAGEIRIADRAYLQPDRVARLLDAGADVIIRAPWNGACWLTADGAPFDLIALLMKSKGQGVVDCPVWMRTTSKTPVGVRLVAIRKPDDAIAATRAKIEAEARAKGRDVQIETLVAAGWVILVTSLSATDYPPKEIGAMYRLRWRIEIAFKHLKSGLGLTRPPGEDPDVAKAHILSLLILALLTEPLVAGHLGDSPRREAA
jgi:IS4 transposase